MGDPAKPEHTRSVIQNHHLGIDLGTTTVKVSQTRVNTVSRLEE